MYQFLHLTESAAAADALAAPIAYLAPEVADASSWEDAVIDEADFVAALERDGGHEQLLAIIAASR